MGMQSGYWFRPANRGDIPKLKQLYMECFGWMPSSDLPFYAIEQPDAGIVMVALSGEEIVATTGILSPSNSIFEGYELALTCTAPEHRGNGLVSSLYGIVSEKLPEDHIPVFASCWRIGWSDLPNLYSLLYKYGFKSVLDARIKYEEPYCKTCHDCPYNKPGCFCSEDLYICER